MYAKQQVKWEDYIPESHSNDSKTLSFYPIQLYDTTNVNLKIAMS